MNAMAMVRRVMDGGVDDMLSAHDKARHGGHFNPETMTCKLRDELKSDTLSPDHGMNDGDGVSRMVCLLKDWIPGCRVKMVTEADARRHKEESQRHGRRGTRFSIQSDTMGRVVSLKDDALMWEQGYRRAAKGVPDVIAECMGVAFGNQGVKSDVLENSEIRVYRSFWHCMEPSNLSARGYYDGKNGHDVTEEEASDVVTAITRPIAVLKPNAQSKDAIRVICEMPNGEGERQYMVVAVKKGDGDGNGYVSLLTMFPFTDDYARGIGSDDFLYLDKKRTQGLRAPTMFVRQLAAFRRSSSMGSIPLSEEDFVEENGDIIALKRSTRNAKADELIKKYNTLLTAGKVIAARDVFWEYAKLKGWERKLDKHTGKTVLVSKDGRKKSDDIEYNGNGYFIPIEERLNDNLPRGDEKAWREGKKTEGARQFDYYFRHFVGKDGRIAGWYNRETCDVAIVDGVATPETVAHEIGWHATFHWAEKHHPKLYEKLMQYAREATDGIKLSVAEKYGAELTEKELLDEIGAERFTREDISPILDASERRDAEAWLGKVENAQNEASGAFVADQAKSQHFDVDAIAELPPKKAVRALVVAMALGKTLYFGNHAMDALAVMYGKNRQHGETGMTTTQDERKVFRDAYGQILGTSETVGGVTIFRDKYGRQVASAAFDDEDIESQMAKAMDTAEAVKRFTAKITADVICIRSYANDGKSDGQNVGKVKRQEILLIQRGKEPNKGMWAFPGGHMDADDDSIETAAKRELKEETGLVAKELRPVGVLSQQSQMDVPCVCHVFVYPFWADGKEGNDVKAADDARNATWFEIGVSYLKSCGRHRVELTAMDGKSKGKKIVFTVRTRHNPIGFLETDVAWDDTRTTAGRLAFDHSNMLSRALLQCPTFLNVSVEE